VKLNYVTVANADGSVNSLAANIAAITPPAFTLQPVGTTLTVNGGTALTTTCASSAPVTYQWNFNGAPIVGATNTTLNLTSIQLNQAGSYTLTASNIAGATLSQAAVIMVKDPPIFVLQPVSQTVRVGTTMTLSAIAISSKQITYQWIFGTNIFGATSTNYCITVNTNSGGNYSLCARNSDGTNYSIGALVTVLKEPPMLTNTLPTSLTFAPGDALSITLPLGGRPPFTIQWYNNGTAISGQTTNPIAQIFQTNMVGSYYACVTNADGALITPSVNILSGAILPTITSQSTDLYVAQGGTASFSATCQNPAGLFYQWMKNRVNMANATNAVLVITNVQNSDVASYSVAVGNQYGVTDSATANLILINPANITAQPQSVLVSPYTSTTFSVTATGYGNIGYQWTFNGANIVGATSSAYTIGSVTTNSQGNYLVKITNPAGTTNSANATLTVKQPPVVAQQPTNTICQPGASPVFAISAVGRGTLTYQWYNGTNTIPGAISNVLVLSSVQLGQNASYYAQVTGADGVVNSATAILTIMAPPAISNSPANVTILPGQSATLSVGATGTPPLYYQWSQNNIAIAGATNNSFAINNATIANQGIYSLTLSNAVGIAQSASAFVTVLLPPTIMVQPTNQVVVIGNNIAISTVASSSTPITYYWLKNGTFFITNASGTLNLNNIAATDLANYSVVLSNMSGTVTSQIATISSLNNGLPPTITTQPQNTAAALGNNASFTVAVTCPIAVNYQWLFNGTIINGKTNQTLLLNNVGTSNVGQYFVTVSNQNGFAQSTAASFSLAAVPQILIQPTNQLVIASQTMAITLVATNATGYQWLLNSNIVASTTLPQLTITNVGVNMGGTWQVIATNQYASVGSTNASITIASAPVITTQPLAKSTAIGTAVTLSVAVGGSAPYTYQWMANENILPNMTNASLTLSNIQTTNEGNYYVVVHNAYGQATSINAYVWVFNPPVITSQPTSTGLNQGQSVALTVTATGRSPFVYTWYHNNSQLGIPSTNSLVIPSVQNADAGAYYVMVANADGAVLSTTATIGVITAPYVSSTTTTIKPNLGTGFTFTPSISGSTPMTCQWYLNTIPIAGATNKLFTVTSVALVT